MRKLLGLVLFLNTAAFLPVTSFSQYILNGNAVKESCNCYLLTNEQVNQSGSVWEETKIDLNTPFDFSFNVYFGCIDAQGADGIVFMLQQQSYNLGGSGGGMGFDGVAPSVGISLDTWQNTTDNDPSYDHISIQANGVIKHGSDLAGPIQVSSTSDNIEDCAWHVFRIKWDPATHVLSTYFDGVFRLSTQTDLVDTIFKNDPMVYWGFSAATGGKFNIQKFCTALNPVFNSGLPSDQICFGFPVTFQDNSTSFTSIKSYEWDFGDGTSSTLANPPPHTYSQPGIYEVKHSITAMDNCTSQPFTRIIKIGDKPTVSFQAFDTCETLSPRMVIYEAVKVGTINQWNWELDGAAFSKAQNPDFSNLSAGNHSLQLSVASDIGCISDTDTHAFFIKPGPSIIFNANDGCENAPVVFTGQQTDKATSISNWHWDFGDNFSSAQKDTQYVYTASATYPVALKATASNGCSSSFSKNIFINSVHADAGNDTLVIPNTPFQLNGSGGSVYSWSPATGLNNPNISNPIGNVTDDVRYYLTVKTAEGCTDTASLKVTVFKGSGIYVPTCFTPNHDGLNDILKPYYIGIKLVTYFTIYNRWGQRVFSTSNMNEGWNGYTKENESGASSYAWVLRAIDVTGKVYNLRGTFTLLK